MSVERKCFVGLAILLAAVGLSACGEKPTVYKQGVYQGKTDSAPWSNDQFKGDKAAWEKAIKTRNQDQNEYSRLTPAKGS